MRQDSNLLVVKCQILTQNWDENLDEVELQTRKDKAFKLYLNILEQLIKDEYSKNGQVFLPTLLMDLSFLKAVAGLALEVL